MRRPITKADIKRWRPYYGFRIRETFGPLGIVVRFNHRERGNWAYSVDARGQPIFVGEKTIDRRKKLGHPKKRKARSILPDTMFSLDEMDLACSIMEELS